jgi:hypothetical protein
MKITTTDLELAISGHSKELYQQSTNAGRILLQSKGYTGRYVDATIARRIKIKGIKSLPKGIYRETKDIVKIITGCDNINEHLGNLGIPKIPEETVHLWIWFNAETNLDLLRTTRKTDLYLKGAGKFKHELDYMCYSKMKYIWLKGYFGVDTFYEYRWLNRKMIVRLVQLDFPIARTDELRFAMQAGFVNLFRHNRESILKRLDDIIARDLAHTYWDNMEINYPEKISILAELNGLEMPKTGLDIKKASRRFRNCANSYIEKCVRGEYFILFDEENMAGILQNGALSQWYGRMNQPPTRPFLTP